jgi:hypothetical protein
MKMRYALMVALVLVAVAGIAHAVSSNPSPTAPEAALAPAGTIDGVTAAPACTAEVNPDDPSGPQRASCQLFAGDCVFDGGPCGPLNQCHCQYRPTGWICGR